MEGTFQIKVIRAELLFDGDWLGKMDPYVVLKLNEQSSQTTVKKSAGKSPSWYETLAFRAKEGDIIRVDVFDKDMFKSDDLVGQGCFEITDILFSNNNLTVKLFVKGSKSAGEVFLETKFFPDPHEYAKIIILLQNQIGEELKQIEKLQKELRNTNKLMEFEEKQKNRKYVITEACMMDNRKDKLEEEVKALEHNYEVQINQVKISIQSRERAIALIKQNIKRAYEYIELMNNEVLQYKNPPKNGRMIITCKEGNFSRNVKTLGTMDPYAVFSLKDNIFSIKKAKNGGKTPVWEETFEIKREGGENILKVEAMSDSDIIGYGFLNINWIVIRGTEYNTQIKLHYLVKESVKEVGYINLILKYEKEP